MRHKVFSGGVLGPDKDSNTDVYKADADPKEIAFGKVTAPPDAGPLMKELRRQAVATTGK